MRTPFGALIRTTFNSSDSRRGGAGPPAFDPASQGIMAKIKIGICDPNQDYAERFAWFVWHRLGRDFEASAFTKPQRLKKARAASDMDVLIMTEAFFRRMEQQDPAAGLKSVPTVVLLTEAEDHMIPGFTCIYRYRSAGQILEDVLKMHRLQERTAALARSDRTRKIAVFSPIRRCGKTSLAAALCEALGQVGSVLFLSFEVLDAHREGQMPGPAVSDLLYGSLIGEDIGALLKQEDRGEQVWRLNSVLHAEDLSHTGPEVAEKLIAVLGEARLRRFLVADLGDLMLPPASLLLQFDSIIMPVLKDRISEEKLSLWQQSLTGDEAAVLAEKTRREDLTFLLSAAEEPQAQQDAAQELLALANRLMLEET